MAFDYKKEYKEFYMPKGTPSIVTVPAMNYIAVEQNRCAMACQGCGAVFLLY